MRAKQLRRRIKGNRPRSRLCAAVLASSLMLGGCTDRLAARIETTPAAEVNGLQKYLWSSAFMIKREGSGFTIKDVSFGLRKEVLEDTPGHEESIYRNPAEIPDSERKERRKLLEQHLSCTKMLNLDKPEIVELLEDNIYLVSPGTYGGSYVSGPVLYRELPHMLLDKGGNIIESNPAMHEKNVILLGEYSPDLLTGLPTYIFMHEHLHDAWASILSEDEYAPVVQILQRLFVQGGDREDRLARLLRPYIFTGGHADAHDIYLPPGQVCEKPEKELLNDFVEENFQDADEKDDIMAGLGWYVSFRARMYYRFSGMVRLRKDTTRSSFIEEEGYPRLFDYNIIPPFMRHLYSPVLTEEALDEAMYARSSAHLQSVETVEAFIPVIEKFMGYVKRACADYIE